MSNFIWLGSTDKKIVSANIQDPFCSICITLSIDENRRIFIMFKLKSIDNEGRETFDL
jgi:hypothetical protein